MADTDAKPSSFDAIRPERDRVPSSGWKRFDPLAAPAVADGLFAARC